jgi:protein-L-isoaspartate(D-aspartate) O-methyltransferase
MLLDTFRHQGLRQKLLSELRTKGIVDERVLAALGRVPRHFFLDSALDKVAYEDRAIPIGAGQTISQPYTVALQSQQLGVAAGEKVLEVGTGSGYQAAVLCELGANLYSIERQPLLHRKAKALLAQMGYRPALVLGDGFEGLPGQAPFDKMLVTCGAGQLPQALLLQLAVGGRMVIPLSEAEGALHLYIIERESETSFKKTKTSNKCSFVPMLQGIAT